MPDTTDPTQTLLDQLGIEVPVICGPMYPGSNPELVAAVSEAGGMGVVQPVTMTQVYGHDFRAGLRLIKSLTDKPFGVNFTLLDIGPYEQRNLKWMEIAIEEGVKFFLTSLGNPKKVVSRAHENGIIVYHDAHTRAFADKALNAGVDGINCLNNHAGGQTGAQPPEALFEAMHDIDVPLVCAGGVGNGDDLNRMLALGYAGALMGTRFLATEECQIPNDYKQALVSHGSADIVHTNKISGTTSSVIGTDHIRKGGLMVNPVVASLLKNRRTKTYTRMALLIRSSFRFAKQARTEGYAQAWQAGKGLSNIHSIEPAAAVVQEFATAYSISGSSAKA